LKKKIFIILQEVHFGDEFFNVSAEIGGLLDAENAAHDGHPKGGNTVELFKCRGLDARSKNHRRFAIQPIIG
jgi:hypothetical protein